jgi:hypothetical protein
MNVARTLFGAVMSAALVLSACQTAAPANTLQTTNTCSARGSTYASDPRVGERWTSVAQVKRGAHREAGIARYE